ncbi:hypothetical protein PED39_02165 [Methanomassiliicoccales archaeon LGM-RCC1]|nr:hypothetical protein [Candidatus Methanomethylophilaceae archaeon]WII08023.1 hypothetical protein PED39_02165 [Methanomassiliicoccales archaeon LGM-RCC1]
MSKNPPPAYDPVSHQILEYLLDHDEAKASDLFHLATWRALEPRLNQLIADGLLTMRTMETGRKIRFFSLTMKGHVCAVLSRLLIRTYRGQFKFEDMEFIEQVDGLEKFTSPQSKK